MINLMQNRSGFGTERLVFDECWIGAATEAVEHSEEMMHTLRSLRTFLALNSPNG